MTGSAILGDVFKVSHRMGIGMAFFTGNAKVFAGQLECKLIMRKVFAEPVDAIMTIDT